MEKKVLGRRVAHSPNYPGRAYYLTKRDEPFTSEKKVFSAIRVTHLVERVTLFPGPLSLHK